MKGFAKFASGRLTPTTRWVFQARGLKTRPIPRRSSAEGLVVFGLRAQARSDLERMGFVFKGGENAMSTVAKNTTSLVDLAKQTLKALSGLPFMPTEEMVNALPS